MEKHFPEIFTPDTKESLGKKIQAVRTISVHRQPAGYTSPHLMKLQELLAQAPTPGENGKHSRDGYFPKAIDIERLEMLEAELQNQCILPKLSESCRSVAQHALHEKNIWRWCARRYGFNSLNIRFVVDIPRYIIRSAEEILSPSEDEVEITFHSPTAYYGKYFEQIHYLEQFAAYLTGNFENNQNRYQRGLNLLLRTLSYAPKPKNDEPQIVVCLPVDKQAFLKVLLSYGQTPPRF